jgi:hypothetical protein
LFNLLKNESNEKCAGFYAGDEIVLSTNLEDDFVERRSLEYEILHEEHLLFEWTEVPHLVSKNHSKKRFPRSPLSWKDNTNEEIDSLQRVERETEVPLQCAEILETRRIVWRILNLRVCLEEH